MKVDVLGSHRSPVGRIELSERVFDVKVSEKSIYYKLRNEYANVRQGTVKTKQRSEVAYSGRKPWKQKGTGRARAGTKRSPIWVGGGTIFGPQPRDYSYVLPKKLRRLAFRSVLTQKVREARLIVIDTIVSENGKTKDFIASFCSFVPEKPSNMILVVDKHDALLKRAARNVPWLKVLMYSQLVLKKLLYAQRVVVTKAAAEKLNVFFDGDAC